MKHTYILFLLCSFFYTFSLSAQIGGLQNFDFLRIPTNARLGGVGGVNVSLSQEDVNMFLQNPALLTEKTMRKAAFSYSPWNADIHHFTAVYAHQFSKIGRLGFALQTVNYGKMELTDPTGVVLGTFSASDFALSATYQFQQDYFDYGVTLKFIGSQIESYKSTALAVDIGATFRHPKQDLTIGLVIKNIGFGLSSYTPDVSVTLPFDIQVGTSFKPEYMPFRFSATLHHLYRWDIVYLDPNQPTQLDINGNPIVEEKRFLDQLARHIVLGGELLIASGFHIRLGYNHLINREMQIRDLGGLRGFSFGLMLKSKAFEFSYSRGTFHLGAGRDFLTLSANLAQIIRKKITKS